MGQQDAKQHSDWVYEEMVAEYGFATEYAQTGAELVKQCQAMIKQVEEGLQKATRGTAVGAPECLSALNSAYIDGNTIISRLQYNGGPLSNYQLGGCFAHTTQVRYGSEPSLSGQSLKIKVSPAMKEKADKLLVQAQRISKLRVEMKATVESLIGESDDLTEWKKNITGFIRGLDQLASGLYSMAHQLTVIYNNYQKAQEDAIHRGMLIQR